MADQRTSSSSTSRRAKAGDDVVGQFIIGAEIGKGSFAQVYSGKHKVCYLTPLPCVHQLGFCTVLCYSSVYSRKLSLLCLACRLHSLLVLSFESLLLRGSRSWANSRRDRFLAPPLLSSLSNSRDLTRS